MKKIVISLATLALLAGCGENKTVEKKAETANTCSSIGFFLPTEYIDNKVITEFEKKHNIKVMMKNFESNEAMLAAIKSGESFDVIMPSEYMINHLAETGYLEKLDPQKVGGYDHIADEVKQIASLGGHEDKTLFTYSMPYMWGNVGIIYNKKTVSLEDLKKDGFGIFKNPKYKGKIYLYDSERDIFLMALKGLGLSMNTRERTDIEKGHEFLKEIAATMEPTVVTDEVIDGMSQGQKDIALVYSGDAASIMNENPDMGYFVPEKGTNLWIDGMTIAANSKCKDQSYELIKYLASDEISKQNATETGYASPNKKVLEEMKDESEGRKVVQETLLRQNPQDERAIFNAESKKIMNELWTKVKISMSK